MEGREAYIDEIWENDKKGKVFGRSGDPQPIKAANGWLVLDQMGSVHETPDMYICMPDPTYQTDSGYVYMYARPNLSDGMACARPDGACARPDGACARPDGACARSDGICA
ncbi:hypothetical protein AMTR_s00068p00142940 [Amborella trichopoda]|uniref:Uncharacterized protein n=1 Tax=Amborella trichopoda TaxID=13333 RepID=U5DE18_AMBTC|nr:hypothetical protein AMTR_s00068p00142940 [Amborella trichopoda]